MQRPGAWGVRVVEHLIWKGFNVQKNTGDRSGTKAAASAGGVPPKTTNTTTITEDGENFHDKEKAEEKGANPEPATVIRLPEPTTASLFNLDAIRLRQDFASDAVVKKALTTVPVRRPGRQDFFRVHPAESHRIPVGLLILEDTGECYAVTPGVADQLGSDVSRRCLVLVVNRQGVLSLWPLAMADENNRLHEWGRSALEAVELAKTHWVRLRSNRSLGAYEVELAATPLPEPTWPDVPFAEIVNVAFRGKIVDTVDHPVVRTLKGAL